MQNGSVWFYLYIPMAILLSYNIVTFSSTVFSLFMYRNQTRNAVGSNTHQKESLVLNYSYFFGFTIQLLSDYLEAYFNNLQANSFRKTFHCYWNLMGVWVNIQYWRRMVVLDSFWCLQFTPSCSNFHDFRNEKRKLDIPVPEIPGL